MEEIDLLLLLGFELCQPTTILVFKLLSIKTHTYTYIGSQPDRENKRTKFVYVAGIRLLRGGAKQILAGAIIYY